MTLLLRATDLIGKPVVTIDGGEDVAEVKDVVYDPDTNRVVGFSLNKRGWLRGPMKQVLPWESVAAVGGDAVMIPGAPALAELPDAPKVLVRPPAGRNVIANAVVTDAGVELGRVKDLVLEVGATADVVGYEMTDGRLLPVPADVAVSGEALVVPAAAASFLAHDLAGFGASVDSFRSHLHAAGPGGAG